MYQLIKTALYFIFIITNLFSFYLNAKIDVSQTNLEATNQSVVKGYSTLQFIDLDLYEDLDKKYLVENFDIVVLFGNAIYSNSESVTGLYGADGECKIPFKYGDGKCNYVVLEEGSPYLEFKKISQLDIENFDTAQSPIILVNNDEIDKLSSYIDNNYILDEAFTEIKPYRFSEFEYGYASLDFVNHNKRDTYTILAFILVITVTYVISKKRYINQIRISGQSITKIFLHTRLKNIVIDLSLLAFLYLLTVIGIYLVYGNPTLTSSYISNTLDSVVLLFTVILITELFTYSYLLINKTEDYLNINKLNIKAFAFILISYYILILFVFFESPISELQKTYISEKQGQHREYLSKYDLYLINTFDFDSTNLSDDELKDIEDIILNRMYTVNDSSKQVTYISDDYAKELFNYDFKNESAFLNEKCVGAYDETLKINTPDTTEYKYSEFSDTNKDESSEEFIDSCYVIVADDVKYLSLFTSIFYNIRFYDNQDVDMSLKIQRFNQIGGENVVSIDFYIALLRVIINVIVTVVATVILLLSYVKLFSREEALRYIYDHNYIFLSKFLFPKILATLLIGVIFIYNSSYIYAIMIITTDLLVYTLLSLYYKSKLIRLKRA